MSTVILNAVTLTGTPAVIGTTVPAGTKRKYTHMLVNNPTAGDVTLDLYNSPDATTADDTTLRFSGLIKAGAGRLCFELIGAGTTPLGAIMAAGLGLTVSYVASDVIES